MIEAFDVHAPENVSEQRAIAHFLGTMDDKIELNRRMNKTQEAIVPAHFKSWPVDFDPVRAKMEGRDTWLLEEIADLLPNRPVDSQMGEKPEGWCATTSQDAIQRLAHLTDGGAYQAVKPWCVLDTAVALTDEQMRLTFSSLVATFLNRQKVNKREAPILTVLCDTLQPELILREIRVPVVEGAPESVT